MPRPENIGPRGRRRRRRLGWIMLVVGVALRAVLWWQGAGRAASLGLFLPFWAAALGFLQARAAT